MKSFIKLLTESEPEHGFAPGHEPEHDHEPAEEELTFEEEEAVEELVSGWDDEEANWAHFNSRGGMSSRQAAALAQRFRDEYSDASKWVGIVPPEKVPLALDYACASIEQDAVD